MIVLDGSHGEGGGQILRTAFVLSLLTDQPFRIENIRLGRPNPGLKPQHMHIGKALLEMCDCQIEGLALGSLALSFYPGTIHGGIYGLDIGTAGAIPLFMQTILPVTMFGDSSTSFVVTGGTDVRGAMTIDFLNEVILPFVRPFAQKLELQVNTHGFYPVGGGKVKLRVVPRLAQSGWQNERGNVPTITIPERGELKRIRLLSFASKDLSERRVAERQISAFKQQSKFEKLESKAIAIDSGSTGSSATAIAEYTYTRIGADSLGERTKSAEDVGKEASSRLRVEVDADCTVDVHTADNLMIWAALFGGAYTFREMTGHIETNAWTIEQFLPGAIRLEGNRVIGLPDQR